MRKVAFPVMAMIVASCTGSVTPSTAMTAAPSTAATGAPPTVRSTLRPTPTPVLGADCPTASPLDVLQFTDADPECFHGEIVISGWLDTPPGMGFEGATVEPQWLYYPADVHDSALWNMRPEEPEHYCPDAVRCGWFFLHLAPGSDIAFTRGPKPIVLRGHIHDPAAATCHYLPAPSDFGHPDDADAVGQCDLQFVVDAIVSEGQ